MQTPSEQIFPHFGRLAGLLLSLGAITGASLVLLDAPLWTFYLAPVAGLPVLFRALTTIDRSSPRASELEKTMRTAGWARSDSLARSRDEMPGAPPLLHHAYADRSAGYLAKIAILLALLGLGAGIAFAVGSTGNGDEPRHMSVSEREAPSQSPEVPPRVQREPSGTPDSDRVPSYASSDGESRGSSPLVPILIAISALAAISIAIVVIRQRRTRAQNNAAPHGRLL
jgi:hypothetical protein